MASGALGILLFLFLNIYDMRYLSCFFFFFILVTSCDDGDIIEVNLEFDEELELCEESAEDYLFFNINENETESLTLLLPISGNRTIFEPEINGQMDSLEINGVSVRFNYRTYSGNPEDLICNFLVNSGTIIVDDFSAQNGARAVFTSTFEDEDGDLIPSDMEGRGNPDGDGNYPDARDSDLDGLADYQDSDDDNDGVPTRNEIDFDDDGNPEFRNTDADFPNGDDLFNHLDADDDGDNVLTINEDENGNGILTDDVLENPDNNPDNLARYLDPFANEPYDAVEIEPTTFERSVTIDIVIKNASIQILQIDTIDFGRFVNPEPLIMRFNDNTGEVEVVGGN